MTPFDVTFEVVIRLGHRARSVPIAELADALGHPPATLRTALLRLLFAISCPDRMTGNKALREPTEGVELGPSELGPSESGRERETGSLRELGRREWGSLRERGRAPLDAVALADALNDPANLSVYQALVARHPAARLEAALRVVLARPAHSIQTTPAAYFTGVLRVLEARASSPPFYA